MTTGTSVARGLLCLVYCLSGLKKLKGDHPAMGEGKPLPGWFLLPAALHEFLTLACLIPWSPYLQLTNGIGLLGSAGFMGGVGYVQFTCLIPKKGMKTAVPWLLVSGLTLYLWESAHNNDDATTAPTITTTLELLRKPSMLMMGGAFGGGVLLGAVLTSLVRNVSVEKSE